MKQQNSKPQDDYIIYQVITDRLQDVEVTSYRTLSSAHQAWTDAWSNCDSAVIREINITKGTKYELAKYNKHDKL